MTETAEVPVETPPELPVETPKEAALSNERLESIRRLLVTLDGQDPEAIQTLNAFLKFNNNIERSNLPTRRDVHLISFLDVVGQAYFPKNENNPFSVFANCIATAFMAKGGDKSKQFVELMKQTPSLADLQTSLGQPQQRSIMDRLLGRGKAEE